MTATKQVQAATSDPNYDRLNEIVKQVKPAEALTPIADLENAAKNEGARGTVVRVDSSWGIIRAIEDAEEYTTIVIAKGRYIMPRDCILNTHHVCIRGETGNREDVIIDGDTEYGQFHKPLSTRLGAPALIKIIRARHVTIADLTLTNSPKYGIMFIGDGRVNNLTVHNVKFHNIWARGLKGTGPYRIDHNQYSAEEIGYDPVTDEHLQWNRPRHGKVQHCLFVNDHPKRDVVDPDEGNYIAAMDLMAIQDWTISDNVFVGIRGASGRGRGAVFIWVESEDVVVENNVFIHCDKALGIGNPHGSPTGSPGKGANGRPSPFHVKNFKIRNNTIVGGVNKGIEVHHGDNIDVYDNRICSFERTHFHAIQVLCIQNKARVFNNVIQTDPKDALNVDEQVEVGENQIGDFRDQFGDIDIGDLRLS